MESMLRNKKTILLFILPSFVLYFCIAFVPVVNSVYYSFFKWNIVGAKQFVGITNFIKLFIRDEVFILSIKNTFLLMGMSILTQMPLAILLAVMLSRNIHLKGLFKTVLFLPNIISSVAIGLLWSFIYNPDFGLVNSILRLLGMDDMAKPWLADEKTVLAAIIITVCWQYIGYHMILFLSAIENIPESLLEAAKIDGAESWSQVFHIILPLLKPIIKIDSILIATGSLRFFDLIYVMTLGGPNHASEVMATHMYVITFRNMQYGTGSAISTILLLFCLGVTVLFNTLFKSKDLEY